MSTAAQTIPPSQSAASSHRWHDSRAVEPVVDCLWQVLSVLSMMASNKNSEDDLVDVLRQLRHDLHVLTASLSTHCLDLVSFDRADADPQGEYYIRLLTGRFVQELIRRMFDDGEVPPPVFCRVDDVQSLMSPSLRVFMSAHAPGRTLSADEFHCWQRLLAWWTYWSEPPNGREMHAYFQYLKQAGWAHMRHWDHCTCPRDFVQLFHTTLRLVSKLRGGDFEYDFCFEPQLVCARHLVTNRKIKGTSDCVLPSLKIRRRNGLWKTVFAGCGITPGRPGPSAQEATSS